MAGPPDESPPTTSLTPAESGAPQGVTDHPGVLDAADSPDPAIRAGEASAAAAVAEEGPADVPADLTAAAFFDVDNTMMLGASIFHFARGLAARKFFTTSDLARLRVAAVQVPDRRPGDPLLDDDRPGHRAVVRRRPPRRRVHRARRGDLRRADGRPDLGRHPGAGADAPRRRAAGVAGHRHPGGAGPRSSLAGWASPERWARSPRASTASTPGGWSGRSCTARRRRTRCERWPSARAWT